MLFYTLSHLRRLLFKLHVLPSYKSSLKVVIVGNISVGGNGKTPTVIALAEHLLSKGVSCAVLLRGYGGTQTQFPYLLQGDDDPHDVGDEPALIARRLNIPVVIDPKRARGAAFIEQHTHAQVLLCDDGLQHYALQRDIELCVMDGRGVGNGYLLPMGPLRESVARLNSVDYIVYNGEQPHTQAALSKVSTDIAQMQLLPSAWVNVKTHEQISLAQGLSLFSSEARVVALAGIGHPQRFFDTLNASGIEVSESLAFADHHQFKPTDMPKADFVLMTEKDAVKCASFAEQNAWYLRVDAKLPKTFYEYMCAKLDV
jgi:tetraacyldisaccharide 4'-kinase